MPRLVFYRETDNLLEYRLRDGRTVIGRSDAADVVVPHDAISRTHCYVERRGESWVLVDRSRHGTRLRRGEEEALIDGEQALAEGDVIELGDFTLRYTLEDRRRERTASARSLLSEPAEAFVAVDRSLTVSLPVLVVTEGPASGARVTLDKPLQTVGGAGSDVVLSDPTLRRDHVRVAVRRGRPMVLQGTAPAFVDGARVRDALPVYLGESIRIGETRFTLDPEERESGVQADSLGEMVGESAAMKRIFGQLRRMARGPDPVLLIGESGTGKELAARAVHEVSGRPGPFVPVNCGAISPSLLESELFGHEKGAFTGAERRHDGAFQRADGGTLFLDEIGEMSEEAQVKLLRALDSGGVRRVGSGRVEYPDVRIVSATNRDLDEATEEGRFRRDLFFRLAVLAVNIPPLRMRMADLPPLTDNFIVHMRKQRHPGIRVTPDARQKLAGYEWPGNVRELRNVLRRAFVMGGPDINAQAITFSPWSFSPPPEVEEDDRLNQQQRLLLSDALTRHNGNRSAVARELGIARSTLHYKLRRYGLGQ